MSFQREHSIIMRFRSVNKLAWIPPNTRGNDREGKSGMTGDTSATCYYDVLVDSGLIGKIDS